MAGPAPAMLALEAFRGDTRAIEGLPVRLVVALVVGVASLSVMLNMLSGIQGLTVAELDARPEPDVVSPGGADIEVTAVGPDGEPVSGATVVVRSGTAGLDGVVTAETGDDGNATLSVSPSLRPNQETGTLIVALKPPAGSGYVDRRGNAEILVVRD